MLALLLLFVGYTVGVYCGSGILLVPLWAWPKALSLQREGRLLSPIPTVKFLAPVAIWSTLLGGSYLLVASLTQNSSAYITGTVLGAIQNIWVLMKPSPKTKARLEANFNDIYAEYLRVEAQS